MEGSIFEKSIELMVVGMGTTFVFLIILVFLMSVLRKFVEFMDKRFPQKQVAMPVPAGTGVNNAVIAVALSAAKRLMK